MPRDFKKENRNFNSKPEEKKRRAKRNAARRKMIKSGRAHKGDGKDVSHNDNNPNNNSSSNLSLKSKSSNRSFPRNKRAGRKR